MGAGAGASLLGAAQANAAVGTQPGTVNLVPAARPTSGTPTWPTPIGCLSGSEGSAVLRAVKADKAILGPRRW